MKISAVDQLAVVEDGDSYASAMGAVYPTNGGNAQSYEADASGKVIKVQPEFSDAAGKRLIFYPIMFSAIDSKYLAPTGTITFRLNNSSADSAIIAQGQMSDYTNGSKSIVADKTWSTADQGKAQTYRDVFKPTTYTITNPDGSTVTVPALAIIGQLPYGTKNDITIFCSCQVDDSTLTSKGSVEIRPMSAENYKVVITSTNNSASNSNDTVINSADETLTLKATLLKNGVSDGISGATYKWHKFGETGITMQDGSAYTGDLTKDTLVVTEQMVGGVAEFVCDVTYQSTTYSESITINDIQDQYVLQKNRTVYTDSTKTSTAENTGILKSGYVVSYAPSVIDKTTGAAYSGNGTWTYTFILKNTAGAKIEETTAATKDVSASTVKANGGVAVIINALNSSI